MGATEKDTESQGSELIEYRLSNIETTLAKVESLLTNNKLQDRDIEDLKKKCDMLERAYNAHDERIRAVEAAPVKARAERWAAAADLLLKLVMSACISVILVKIGLK